MINVTSHREFITRKPEEVIDFLKSRELKKITVNPQKLKLVKEGEQLLLFINDKIKTSFPVRLSFIYRILKWFGINFHSVKHLPEEMIIDICNINFQNIQRRILLHIEDNSVVSLTSPNFTFVSDLEIIERVSKKKTITSITRDDFITRIFTKIDMDTEPIVGDISAISFNVINSETGFSRLRVEHYIYRYYCSNGASAPILYSNQIINTKHIYDTSDDLVSRVMEMISNSEESGKLFAKKLKESTQKQAFKYFPNLNSELASLIPSYEGYYFFKDLRVTVNSTKYDVYNYITNRAKRFNIYDRYKIENFAGKFILGD